MEEVEEGCPTPCVLDEDLVDEVRLSGEVVKTFGEVGVG